MPLTNGSGNGFGSGSFYFHHWPSRCQQKIIFFVKVFLRIIFEGTFTSFFKDKKSKRSRNQGFSYYFCLMEEESWAGSGSILWLLDPDPGGPKTGSGGSGFGSRNTAKYWDTIGQSERTPFLIRPFWDLRYLHPLVRYCLSGRLTLSIFWPSPTTSVRGTMWLSGESRLSWAEVSRGANLYKKEINQKEYEQIHDPSVVINREVVDIV